MNLGEYDPFYGTQNAFHRCAIGLYFLSFFIEHPVSISSNFYHQGKKNLFKHQIMCHDYPSLSSNF